MVKDVNRESAIVNGVESRWPFMGVKEIEILNFQYSIFKYAPELETRLELNIAHLLNIELTAKEKHHT